MEAEGMEAEGMEPSGGAGEAATCPEPDYDIDELRALGQQQLLQLAVEEQAAELSALSGLSRRELVARLLFERGARGHLGRERGILQVRPEGFGFLRSVRHHYQNGPDDIYVSPNQIRRLRLRDGDEVSGATRLPRGEEGYLALWRVEEVNGLPVRKLFQRVPFQDLTPVLPRQRLRLVHEGGDDVLRLVELLAPMALGHRALIRLPAMFGGLDLLAALAEGVAKNHPRARVLVLQVGERPEEHAELARRLRLVNAVNVEVCASTFGERPALQAALTRFVLARAWRLVETRHDVVLILDSLNQLVRAHNMVVPHSGKIIGPDLDAAALEEPKALFASARCAEEGGSLTIFGTLRGESASIMDRIIGREFQDRANAEIVVHEDLCEAHGHLGLDVFRTRTRREDDPTDAAQRERLQGLRSGLARQPAAAALRSLLTPSSMGGCP